ncbi:MAG: DUF1731 domain-containing protein [Acidobacteria bacterium]|nr:MAG: DUF1731 domain-containing protein [Acidobacteriota bacterium]
MSWIALDDLTEIIKFSLENDTLEGPVNCTAPNPVTNKEFTITLGKVLNRPTFIPLPSLLIKCIFGEMGEALLLQGNKVVPKKLLEKGFKFRYPDLEIALRKILER